MTWLGWNSDCRGTYSTIRWHKCIKKEEEVLEWVFSGQWTWINSLETCLPLHIETFLGLTQQSATTESSGHFLGFPPWNLHTQGLLAPHPAGGWSQQGSLTKVLTDLLCNGLHGHQNPISGDWDGRRFQHQQLVGNFLLSVIGVKHLTSKAGHSGEKGQCVPYRKFKNDFRAFHTRLAKG